MFVNRIDAGLRLARRLKKRPFHDPVVLGIPRGGVVVGAVLAKALHADLDVVLSRKLRAPGMPEVAVGAVGEDGSVYLDPDLKEWLTHLADYLEQEIRWQKGEIARRKKLLRGDRQGADVSGRSVILTDDGIATGSTMIAALRTLKGWRPHEIVVAVPVAVPDRLPPIRALADEVVSLLTPTDLWAIAQYYKDFRQVEDDQVVSLLRAHRTLPVASADGE